VDKATQQQHPKGHISPQGNSRYPSRLCTTTAAEKLQVWQQEPKISRISEMFFSTNIPQKGAF